MKETRAYLEFEYEALTNKVESIVSNKHKELIVGSTKVPENKTSLEHYEEWTRNLLDDLEQLKEESLNQDYDSLLISPWMLPIFTLTKYYKHSSERRINGPYYAGVLHSVTLIVCPGLDKDEMYFVSTMTHMIARVEIKE